MYVVKQVLKCWVHENSRVFGDRLICEEDRQWLKQLLLQQTENNFGLGEAQIFTNERLVFADFCNPAGDRFYEVKEGPVPSW